MNPVHFAPLSETAIIVDFGQEISIEKNKYILNVTQNIQENPFPGFIEAVPTYTTLTIHINPFQIEGYSFEKCCNTIRTYLHKKANLVHQNKTVYIPVCYEDEFAPDLSFVAEQNNLTTKQVIQYHTEKTYHVYFLGFSPGFPFLAGLDKRISTPRKQTPRTLVPTGAVGIAGEQTGVYPSPTPGGWQIIGRTPVSLLRLNMHPPTLLQPGDQVKFYSISKHAFYSKEA